MRVVVAKEAKILLAILLAAMIASAILTPSIRADEGMWTYDRVPFKQLKKRYDFTPSQAWLDHLRFSSVRVYASASFVSPDGLILTNHHVALAFAQKLSTGEKNLVHDGFYARTRDEEIRVPGMSVEVLQSMKDVTAAVKDAAKKGATPAEAESLRKKAISKIEASCLKETGLSGEIVSLYGGARYVLYRYKQYTDLRLVFIPEMQAAFFGGDWDNFVYPRYALDMAFFRAYENDKPARVKNYLEVNPKGAPDGALVIVSGHPASTDRLKTIAALDYYRQYTLPARIGHAKHVEKLLKKYSAGNPEKARRARTALFFTANSLKAVTGELKGLRDPSLMGKKAASEKSMRRAVADDPELAASIGNPWKELATAYSWAAAHEKDRLYRFHIPGGGWGRLPSVAVRLVRYAQEIEKPDADRLPGFHDAELPNTLRYLKSPSPYYKDIDELLLADDLRAMARVLGPDDPYVKELLNGLTPAETAAKLLKGTKLDEVAFRMKLLKKKGKKILSSSDPLLRFARKADPTLRKTLKLFEDNLYAVEEATYPRIARAQFAVKGDDAYPDATGTLRLAFGKVAGYPFATTLVPSHSTFYGLYDRAFSFGDKGDFALTKRERERVNRLKLSTPMDFVCTADITGGNSGSPVVDRDGRLVGLVFDGNQQSHPNTFVYSEDQARCVAVDIRGILESLEKLYDAGPLVREMTKAKSKK